MNYLSIKYAQCNIRSKKLASRLVSQANFTNEDIVFEIGTGPGLLTMELARYAKKVISFEIDKSIYNKILNRFSGIKNITLLNMDFLDYKIKKEKYHVFANIPFNCTTKIMRKLFFNKNPPDLSYLVMQKEAVYKYTGKPRLTKVSLLFLPGFDVRIIWKFKRTDFFPPPGVDVTMVKIRKRTKSLVKYTDWQIYKKLIDLCFVPGSPNLKRSLKRILGYTQAKTILNRINVPLNTRPNTLRYLQWLKLFYYIKDTIKIK